MNVELAVIPVAGFGTRLLPTTKSQPKEMLPVGRKPVVQHVVEELTEVGMKQVLFITGPGKAAIENHFDRDESLISKLRHSGKEELLAALEFESSGPQFFYTRQKNPLGLGHAISCARQFVGHQPFVVALGDSIIGLSKRSRVVDRMKKVYIESGAVAVVAFESVPITEVSRYGIAQPKSDGDVFEVADLIEKPHPSRAPSQLAIAARYILSPAIFTALDQTPPGAGGEIQLTDAIKQLITANGRVMGVRLSESEKRYDIGNFESYFEAFVEFALADDELGPQLARHVAEILRATHP